MDIALSLSYHVLGVMLNINIRFVPLNVIKLRAETQSELKSCITPCSVDIQGDQKISAHLMITVQKHAKIF
jgi:hypothetical protein